MYDIKTMSE